MSGCNQQEEEEEEEEEEEKEEKEGAQEEEEEEDAASSCSRSCLSSWSAQSPNERRDIGSVIVFEQLG